MDELNESLEEYKKRIIDPISDSFCAAKWYDATIFLGHGQTASCHQPPAHKIPLEELKNNFTAIHNTKHKKFMRKLMLEGKRPHECFQCWEVEDTTKKTLSERVPKTCGHLEEEILLIPSYSWDANILPKKLEIAFDRACNFACSYCNPAFSSTWVKDIKTNGPYENIKTDNRGHFIDVADWAENVASNEDDNPYIQAFWKWWESELADNLKEIRVTGGEPILHSSVWKLFNWFKNNPDRGRNMTFSINTNLVPEKEKTFNKFLEISQYLPNFQIFTSCESTGLQAEYIRDGLKYNVWLENTRKLLNVPEVTQFGLMATMNALCLGKLTELLDTMLELKKEYDNRVLISLNLLSFPEFQSIRILPEYIRSYYNDKLKLWYSNCNKKLLNLVEISHIERIIHHIDHIKKENLDKNYIKKLQSDFKTFYVQYDRRRNKNFYKTFDPIIVEWFDSIEIKKSKSVPRGGDPASTKIYKN